MKSEIELKLYKFIKYFALGNAIIQPIVTLYLKFALKENISLIAIIIFPIMCFIIIKFMDFCIRKTEKENSKKGQMYKAE